MSHYPEDYNNKKNLIKMSQNKITVAEMHKTLTTFIWKMQQTAHARLYTNSRTNTDFYSAATLNKQKKELKQRMSYCIKTFYAMTLNL